MSTPSRRRAKERPPAKQHPEIPYPETRLAFQRSVDSFEHGLHPMPRSTSNQSVLSETGRGHAPAKAVFIDLQSAHSSITSRTGKGKYRVTSESLSEEPDEEYGCAIPLRDLASLRDQKEYSMHSYALPYPPAMIVRGRNSSNHLLGLETDSPTPDQRSKPADPLTLIPLATPTSLLASIKNALNLSSSPATPGSDLDAPLSGWPRDRTESSQKSKRKSEEFDRAFNALTPSAKRTATDESRKRLSGHYDGIKSPSSSDRDRSSSALPSDGRAHETMSCLDLRNSGDAKTQGDSPSLALGSSSVPGVKHSMKRELSSRHSISGDRVGSSSVPESSTIGDIYKHYVQSSNINDTKPDQESSDKELAHRSITSQEYFARRASENGFSLSSSSLSDELIPSALRVRRYQNAEDFPLFPLPKDPSLIFPPRQPGEPASSPLRFGNSSSYGDTKELLGMKTGAAEISREQDNARRQASRSDQTGRLDETETGEVFGSSPPQLPALRSNNPFLRLVPPQLVVSPAPDDDRIYDQDSDWAVATKRQPLEREVSQALRRASGYSAYSNGSISSSVLDGLDSEINEPSEIGLLRRQNVEWTPPSDTGSFTDDQRTLAAQAQAFYDEGAIPPDWLASDRGEGVRVPIKQAFFPDSPPETPRSPLAEYVENDIHATPRGNTQADEWETVGESAFGIPEFTGAPLTNYGFRRAGSSLADNSDNGISTTTSGSSLAPEIEYYDATERIAQHPGNFQYHGDYRQRDLKGKRIPVFLPVYREHKVNGYLADSNRIRPPPTQLNINRRPSTNYSRPRPLTATHSNPFRDAPPEIVSPRKAKDLARRQHLDSPSTDTLVTSEISTEDTMEDKKRRTTARHVSTSVGDWLENFADVPGPSLGIPQHLRLHTGFTDTMDYNLDGQRGSSEQEQRSALFQGLLNDTRFPNTRRPSTKIHAPEVSTPVAKGRIRSKLAPGAFYQGLRKKSREVSGGKIDAYVQGRTVKNPAHPTNRLRPLSLMSRPKTPMEQIIADAHKEAHTADFVYRSPLAPPKNPKWRGLYSDEQLKGMNASGKQGGLYGQHGQMRANEDPTNSVGSRRHLWEAPRLFSALKKSTTLVGFSERKSTMSVVVLMLCNLFPPLLMLYANGRLDGIMVWWSDGDYLTFSRRQKRMAYFLLAFWILAVFIGVIAFLVVWFTKLHHH